MFLLSAGSSLPTRQTLDVVRRHLELESLVGGYAAAGEATADLQQGRADLGELVGGRADEIALVPSDSVGWVKAWWGWVVGGNVPPGSVVLIDRLTYHSHFAALSQTQPIGRFDIQVLPSLPDGTIDISATEIRDDVSALCLTMVGTHCGNVNPIAELGSLAAAAGVPLFLDACQALGQLAIDVRQLGCQVLTGTGRKFMRGPRGTGLLWVASELIDRFQPPGLDAVNAEWSVDGNLSVKPGIGRFEEFEFGYAAMLGLGAAARQALDLGMTAIEARVGSLADQLRTGLAEITGVTVHDTAARRSGIVTFTVPGVDPPAIVDAAARDGIIISTSTAQWATLDMDAKGLDQVVRASPHYFNTEAELDKLVGVVHGLTP